MICIHCGAENEDGAVRCHSCHSLLKISITQEVLDQASAECLSPVEILRICQSVLVDEPDMNEPGQSARILPYDRPVRQNISETQDKQTAGHPAKTLSDEEDAPTDALVPAQADGSKTENSLPEDDSDSKPDDNSNKVETDKGNKENKKKNDSYQPRHSSGKRRMGPFLRSFLITFACMAVLAGTTGIGWTLVRHTFYKDCPSTRQNAVVAGASSSESASSTSRKQSLSSASDAAFSASSASASKNSASGASAKEAASSAQNGSSDQKASSAASLSEVHSEQPAPQPAPAIKAMQPRQEMYVRTEPNLEDDANIARTVTPDQVVNIVEEFTVPEYPQLTFGRLEDGYVVCIAGNGESYFDVVE